MNHKITSTLIGICALIYMLAPQAAQAQAYTGNGGNFGIGIMVGEPTGVSVKTWMSANSAIGLGAAWSLAGSNEAVHLHADYLQHSWFSNVDNGQLAFYFGLGGRIIFASDAEAGIRIPLGLNYVFESAPFDIFVEAVPILNLTPDTDFAGNGAAGIRYYF